MKHDGLGERIKSQYELPETSRRFAATEIIYARIDGRRFSRFTKEFIRPFDDVFAQLMQKAAATLVAEFQPLLGYVQSDEISLLFANTRPESAHLYDGRIQKLVSTLAATTTSIFTLEGLETMHRERFLSHRPSFDARVFAVPSQEEAANAILWRCMDCLKNAKSQFARHYLSPQEMHGKSGDELVALVLERCGADFTLIDDYYKYGYFYRLEPTVGEIGEEVFLKIPEGKRPFSRLVERSEVKSRCCDFRMVANRAEFIFEREEPLQK